MPVSEGSLNWRKVIEGAGLSGPIKNLASQAQVLTLEKNLAVLRLSVAAFATESNREMLEQNLSRYFGYPFHVRFEVGELTAATVSDEVTAERLRAQHERVERFKADPLVKRFMTELGAVLEESTVKEQR